MRALPACPKSPVGDFVEHGFVILRHLRHKKGPPTGALFYGGQGGIRTHDTLAGMPHFECGAFNRSTTCPSRPDTQARLGRQVFGIAEFLARSEFSGTDKRLE
jgi:hypothetical protein